MGQKRGRDAKASTAQANKRKKATNIDGGSDDERSVGVEDLNWKEVAMPDRMEDAEGFFGLEEIEGVDIIKTSGEVQFKVGVNTVHISRQRLTYLLSIRPGLESQENQSSSLPLKMTTAKSGVDAATKIRPSRLLLLKRPPPKMIPR